jgi:MFS family permease
MLWTESLFSFLPIKKEVAWQQILVRIGFLIVLWLTGLLTHAIDGMLMVYLLNVNVYLSLFGTSFIILFGSYYVQRTQKDVVQNFRPMLKLDDLHFQRFFQRLKRFSYSILPILFIAICYVVLGGPDQFREILIEGFKLHAIWSLSVTIFGILLAATAIWMFVSIWLTIFLISRQPLNVKLSSETVARFRELSMFALFFSLFYFLGVSIGNIPFLTSTPTLSLQDIIISPYLFFIVVGIIGIIFPFHNIHATLLKMKQQELSKIMDESQQLLHQLDAALNEPPSKQLNNQTITIMARLLSLQVREKHVRAAQEWPIDTSFLSKLIVLGLIPIVSRLVVMMILS